MIFSRVLHFFVHFDWSPLVPLQESGTTETGMTIRGFCLIGTSENLGEEVCSTELLDATELLDDSLGFCSIELTPNVAEVGHFDLVSHAWKSAGEY